MQLTKTLSTKPSNLCWQNFFQAKFTYLEHNANGVQVGGIEQVIV